MNVQFPNAAIGVKKIYIAEIMTLISTIIIAASSIVGIFITYKAIEEGNAALLLLDGIVIILDIIAGVFLLIAFIKHLTGLVKASKDNPTYGTVFSLIVFKIVLQIASIFIKQMDVGAWSQIFMCLYNIINLLIIVFIIQATCELADALGREDVVTQGQNVLTIVMIIYIIISLASLAPAFFSHQLTEIILVVAIAVLSIVAYCLYLSLLSKAIQALEAS